MNQVAEKKKTDIALASMFEEDANTAIGEMGAEDFALPFLRVLGQLSPEINKRDAKYIEGAEAGMIFNTVTKQVYDGEKGINIIPCHYKREYVEWSDRGQGTSAPVAIHPSTSDIINQAKRDANYKDRLSNGNYLENTANHFVLTLGKSPENVEHALISMKSTQLKVSRKWNSMMMGIKMQGKNGLFTPPTYSHIYKLSTVQMSNDKGTWFGWDVSKAGPVENRGIYDMAKTFAASVSKGEVEAKPETKEAKKEFSL